MQSFIEVGGKQVSFNADAFKDWRVLSASVKAANFPKMAEDQQQRFMFDMVNAVEVVFGDSMGELVEAAGGDTTAVLAAFTAAAEEAAKTEADVKNS